MSEPNFDVLHRWEQENDAIVVALVPADMKAQYDMEVEAGEVLPPWPEVWEMVKAHRGWRKGVGEVMAEEGITLLSDLLADVLYEYRRGRK